MAFGFPPTHTESFQVDQLDNDLFLLFAIEATKKLNWDVSFISENRFIAYTKFSMVSWSEEVNISISENTITIESACTSASIHKYTLINL